MKTYTYQIGQDEIVATPKTPKHAKPAYAEEIHANGLGEAIDKAKAITNLRAHHANEITVRILENGGAVEPVWTSSVEDIRAG